MKLHPYDPSMRHVTREEMQEIDRRAMEDFGIPGETLMENAGKAVAGFIQREYAPKRVVVICGPGNNGGDGFVIARLLDEEGANARITSLVNEYRGDALLNYERARSLIRKPEGEPDLIVDAVFGTGLTRSVEGIYATTIRAMNESPCPKIAVDIPSGLDANTGASLGVAVHADATITMGLPKVGFKSRAAQECTGVLWVADIGFPGELLGR